MKKIILVFLILLIIIIAELSYLIYKAKKNIVIKPTTPQSRSLSINSMPASYSAGLKNLAQIDAKYNEFVNRVQFQVVFTGKLYKQTDKEIVLIKDKKIMNIPIEALIKDKINYFKAPINKSGQPNKIVKDNLLEGDSVEINVVINPASGKMFITHITQIPL